jgi:hypothetical protein
MRRSAKSGRFATCTGCQDLPAPVAPPLVQQVGYGPDARVPGAEHVVEDGGQFRGTVVDPTRPDRRAHSAGWYRRTVRVEQPKARATSTCPAQPASTRPTIACDSAVRSPTRCGHIPPPQTITTRRPSSVLSMHRPLIATDPSGMLAFRNSNSRCFVVSIPGIVADPAKKPDSFGSAPWPGGVDGITLGYR